MSYKNFYKKQYKIFQTYIRNTNQKEILANNIIKKISFFNLKKDKKFIYTDIGAGDGAVSIPVINFLRDSTNLTCNIIEPSNMIKDFQKNCNFKNINYYKQKSEVLTLPKSDFIVISHVMVYLDNFSQILKDIYTALNNGGFALIVETNQNSDDVKLKTAINRKRSSTKNQKTTRDISKMLEAFSINYDLEVISSDIDVSGCAYLNDDGKAIISFFYHRPFVELTLDEIKDFKTAINQLSKRDNKLTKIEDYIWITK